MSSNHRKASASTVDRVSTMLDCFSHREPTLTVSEIARRTGLAKSTTSRLVATLVQQGLLERQGREIMLGLRLFELGEKASRPRLLRRLTYAQMQILRNQTGHTVHLAVLDGRDVVYIEILRARNTPRLPSRVGGRVPAHATGVGQALLAFSHPSVVEYVIEGGLAQMGPRTITEPEALRAALWRTRSSGFAVEREESGPGIACVASALLVADLPVAAISVSGWVGDIDVEACAQAVESVVRGLRHQAQALPTANQTI